MILKIWHGIQTVRLSLFKGWIVPYLADESCLIDQVYLPVSHGFGSFDLYQNNVQNPNSQKPLQAIMLQNPQSDRSRCQLAMATLQNGVVISRSNRWVV